MTIAPGAETLVFPTMKAVRDLLIDLFGDGISTREPDVPLTGEVADIIASEWKDNSGRTVVVALLDYPLAVYLGACLGLLPPGGARDMALERSASTMVMENAAEALNILTSLFNVPGGIHLRMGTMHKPGSVEGRDIARRMVFVGGRLDVDVTLNSYGSGKMAFGAVS